MKTELIKGNTHMTQINFAVTHNQQLKYEIYSFIDIVSNSFDLRPCEVQRIRFIFDVLWNEHTTFFNSIRYENTVLGIMLFVHDEFCKRNGTENGQIDVTNYIVELYGVDSTTFNRIQVYTVYQNVKDIMKS